MPDGKNFAEGPFSMNAEYAVIVVTYQREREVQRTLAAIETQSVGREAMEICVVDNGGSEAARPVWKDRVDRWVDSGANLGCAGGRNRGVAETRAPTLVFVDDDGVPIPTFVEALGDVLRNHPEAVAVRGKAVSLDHPLLTAMAVHYDRGPLVCDELLTLEGGSAIRREAYAAAGGYDETRAYHEGVELSGRLLETRRGARILYTPHAVLRHDYLQGFEHFKRKARMLARANERVDTEEDPRVQATLRRRKSLPSVDGRPVPKKLVGWAVGRTFAAAIRYYRARS